ncbi:hypothetical protein XA68_10520 [Ophiocordyceps unilateralis]|uniref:Reverse transcriptase domain-containing protein n=1 Tax=Ophiocordyceps unilateralis TaxID=268505 RepID=A0A2A9NYZ7_OPHUN|nr:hypothetical protein XA68_10520 [Ophiocordyceps unilateralis]
MKVPLAENWHQQRLGMRPYPLNRPDKEFLDAKHQELHDQGRMEWTTEASPFASPVFVVWRKDKPRVVVDLRALNSVAIPDAYPMPIPAEMVHKLAGKRYISAVDARSFFHQFLVHPDHRERFTVVSHRGLERSVVALMGYKNSPAYAQRFIDHILRDYSEYAAGYIDDIVIYSNTAKEYLNYLKLLGFRVDGF